MTRDLSSNALAAISADVVAPVLMVKLEFDGGNVCLHTGLGEIEWAGDTYVGASAIGFINGIQESSDSARQTIEMGLRGLPGDILSIALNEHYQNRPATIFHAPLNPQTMQLAGDPWVVRRGLMDNMNPSADQTVDITLTIESEQAQWDRPVTRRYTDADQRMRHPADRFFEFVSDAAGQSIYWGQRAPA